MVDVHSLVFNICPCCSSSWACPPATKMARASGKPCASAVRTSTPAACKAETKVCHSSAPHIVISTCIWYMLILQEFENHELFNNMLLLHIHIISYYIYIYTLVTRFWKTINNTIRLCHWKSGASERTTSLSSSELIGSSNSPMNLLSWSWQPRHQMLGCMAQPSWVIAFNDHELLSFDSLNILYMVTQISLMYRISRFTILHFHLSMQLMRSLWLQFSRRRTSQFFLLSPAWFPSWSWTQ